MEFFYHRVCNSQIPESVITDRATVSAMNIHDLVLIAPRLGTQDDGVPVGHLVGRRIVAGAGAGGVCGAARRSPAAAGGAAPRG